MNLLDFTLALNMIGSLLFDRQVREEYFVSTIVMLVIAIVYLFCPKRWIFSKIYPEKFNLEEKTFDEAKSYFKHTYGSQHPLIKLMKNEKNHMKMLSHGYNFDEKALSPEKPVQV